MLWDIGIAGGTQCKQEIMSSVGREKEKEEKTDKREIVKTEKNSCKIGYDRTQDVLIKVILKEIVKKWIENMFFSCKNYTPNA